MNRERSNARYSNINTNNIQSDFVYKGISLLGPYDLERPQLDVSFKMMNDMYINQNDKSYYQYEKKITISKDTQRDQVINQFDLHEEFGVLEKICKFSKQLIKGFEKHNIYQNIVPFIETGVILNSYDQNGRKIC